MGAAAGGATAAGWVPGLRNIEAIRPVPNPRLIDWWIGSIGVIEIGACKTGGFGMVADGPAPIGLVGTLGEAIGTVPGHTVVLLIESPIEGIGARPTAG